MVNKDEYKTNIMRHKILKKLTV